MLRSYACIVCHVDVLDLVLKGRLPLELRPPQNAQHGNHNRPFISNAPKHIVARSPGERKRCPLQVETRGVHVQHALQGELLLGERGQGTEFFRVSSRPTKSKFSLTAACCS